eukprot:501139-Pelagomonas_calceolata.AAC.7
MALLSQRVSFSLIDVGRVPLPLQVYFLRKKRHISSRSCESPSPDNKKEADVGLVVHYIKIWIYAQKPKPQTWHSILAPSSVRPFYHEKSQAIDKESTQHQLVILQAYKKTPPVKKHMAAQAWQATIRRISFQRSIWDFKMFSDASEEVLKAAKSFNELLERVWNNTAAYQKKKREIV